MQRAAFIWPCLWSWDGIFGGRSVWVTQRIMGKGKGGPLRWPHLGINSFSTCSYLQVGSTSCLQVAPILDILPRVSINSLELLLNEIHAKAFR